MTELAKAHPTQRRRFFELDGQVLCLRDWARRGGMSEMTLKTRLAKGMSLREALAMPLNPNYQASAARTAAKRWHGSSLDEVQGPQREWRAGPTRRAWGSMITRCTNPNHKSYMAYGGRGVEVCERWKFFCNFLEDMGERPAGMTLDRRDNTKGYFKENCRWATVKEQNRNRAVNRWIAHDGITKCMADWADEYGLKQHTLRSRLDSGWDFVRAITEPVRGTKIKAMTPPAGAQVAAQQNGESNP